MAASPAAQLRELSILGPSVLHENPQFNKIVALKPKDSRAGATSVARPGCQRRG
jgi:hypothetical protein